MEGRGGEEGRGKREEGRGEKVKDEEGEGGGNVRRA